LKTRLSKKVCEYQVFLTKRNKKKETKGEIVMGQLSRSFGRFVRGIIRVISFGFIKLAEPLEKSPEMIGMRYEEVIADKAKTARGLKNAIGAIMAEEEIIRSRAKTISNELDELKQDRDGAQAYAKERFEVLIASGMTQEQALQDKELQEYQSAYNDAVSTIEAKEANLTDLGGQADHLKSRADDYVLQAKELSREVAKLRAERHEAEADARLAKEFDSINESIAGISDSGAEHKLVELRRDVAQVKGRAKASARIAEVDVSAQRAKLRAKAKATVSNVEFLKAIGAKSVAPKTVEKPVAASKETPPKIADTPGLPE